MRLTMFTDYSVRVLLLLASRPGTRVTIARLAAQFRMSEAHTTKVVHTLAKTKWIETVRGRGGGLRLAIDPQRLTLRRIVQTMESDFQLVDCFRSDARCPIAGGCGVERALGRALQAFYAELGMYTLAQLADRSPALARLPRLGAHAEQPRLDGPGKRD
jgi:Rrf2 family transcriptional regulator, nitric oxide-sensitive transcriptional repressor